MDLKQFSTTGSSQEIPTTTVEHAAESPDQHSEPEDEAAGAAAATPAADSESESFRYSIPFVYNLPGPSQVVTHPGTSGTNSHGERQRRRGVSGPPSGRKTKHKSRIQHQFLGLGFSIIFSSYLVFPSNSGF